jgi:hypothetical protein
VGTILRRLWEMGKQIAVKREGDKLVREVRPIIKQGRKRTYKVTLRRVRAPIVAVEKQ